MINIIIAAFTAAANLRDFEAALRDIFAAVPAADLDAFLASGPAGFLAASRPNYTEILRFVSRAAKTVARRPDMGPARAAVLLTIATTANETRRAVLRECA